VLGAVGADAQQSDRAPWSIHRIELESHRTEQKTERLDTAAAERPSGLAARPSKRVFGYRPYWAPASDYLSYDFNALTDIGYFSAEIDTATGTLGALHGWPSAPVIAAARAHGVKVSLVAICFDYDATDKLLGNLTKREALIASLVDAINNGQGDGINIDFEAVRPAQRSALVAFIQALSNRLHAAVPGASLSMALPAVDWSNAFDLAQLSSICDFVVLMAYDYHYAGSQNAGPVAPLAGESYNVTRSVTTYLNAGVPASKLLLGVPWYGYDWRVSDSTRGASTLASGTSVYYKAATVAAAEFGRRFDAATSSAWYIYGGATQWHQAWFDDSTTLGLKYRLVTEKGLGGVGIWALSYETGAHELWSGLAQAFSAPTGVVAEHTQGSPAIASTPGGILVTTPGTERVSVQVYDILGRHTATLFDGRLPAGSHLFPLGGAPAGANLVVLRYGGESRSIGLIVK
jgi:spore germination protein YaaH